MNRAFYSLPNPREAGLRWRQFEQARKKVERIEQRLRETQRRRAEVEERIKYLGDAEVRNLAEAILAGEDGPAGQHEQHEKLVAELRELRLQGQATAEALPVAEEELRQVVYEHQPRWKGEADSALAKAIKAERQAYDKVRALIEEPRAKRLYAEELTSGSATHSLPSATTLTSQYRPPSSRFRPAPTAQSNRCRSVGRTSAS